MSSTTLSWLVWGFAAFLALRCLISLADLLGQRLREILVNFVKRQRVELHKKRRIRETREKLRQLKANQAEAEARKTANRDTTNRAA